MSIEMSSDRAVCSRCGRAYGRRKGNFPVSYAILHKGIGFIPVCKDCINMMYDTYLAKCSSPSDAVRQMCRKLDLYWNEKIFDMAERTAATKSVMMQYIAKINTATYAGKSYDDTLLSEGTLWSFTDNNIDESEDQSYTETEQHDNRSLEDIPDDVIAFWGPGYTADMYDALQQRRTYWESRMPDDFEMDIGTEALIRQICSLEIDINKDRAKGRSADKNINALNALLGSANLKPTQRKRDDADATLSATPLGVWLYRYENQRPIPEPDDDMKDVNGVMRYVFTWFGHVLKMLGIKNKYSQLYDEAIKRLRVEQPEYDGDDDELFFESISAGGE